MSLYHESRGNGSCKICFVHGFTQTGKSWIEAANSIANSTNTFVDAPDHGESQGTSLTLQESGDAIAKIAHGTVLIGYSMGARMALHAAIQNPQSMTGLVLVSGTPGIEDKDERTLRVERKRITQHLLRARFHSNRKVLDWSRQYHRQHNFHVHRRSRSW